MTTSVPLPSDLLTGSSLRTDACAVAAHRPQEERGARDELNTLCHRGEANDDVGGHLLTFEPFDHGPLLAVNLVLPS